MDKHTRKTSEILMRRIVSLPPIDFRSLIKLLTKTNQFLPYNGILVSVDLDISNTTLSPLYVSR